MSRDINKLKEPFRTSVKQLVKQAEEINLPILITDTTRTLAEQRVLVKKGFSKTLKSKHLIGEAVDIAFTVGGKLSYSPSLYAKLYRGIVKNLPYVIWPFKDLHWDWDPGHFQYDKTKKGDTLSRMKEEEYKDKIRELNTEIGEVTRARDNYKDSLIKERAGHAETLDKLDHCEAEREQIAGEGREAKSLLNRIKNFFT